MLHRGGRRWPRGVPHGKADMEVAPSGKSHAACGLRPMTVIAASCASAELRREAEEPWRPWCNHLADVLEDSLRHLWQAGRRVPHPDWGCRPTRVARAPQCRHLLAIPVAEQVGQPPEASRLRSLRARGLVAAGGPGAEGDERLGAAAAATTTPNRVGVESEEPRRRVHALLLTHEFRDGETLAQHATTWRQRPYCGEVLPPGRHQGASGLDTAHQLQRRHPVDAHRVCICSVQEQRGEHIERGAAGDRRHDDRLHGARDEHRRGEGVVLQGGPHGGGVVREERVADGARQGAIPRNHRPRL
mmetsp:Transcript_128628/g.372212  ORF Transcript_128628/g.372212 Transcript_128628/m.372212 type:complete len:302 (-) Transcript_128628:127-1032(-)